MNFFCIVLIVVLVSTCKSSGANLEKSTSTANDGPAKSYSEADYHKIKKSVELTADVEDRVQTNTCYAPAIAAWVDFMKKEAARTRQRLPGRFGIVEIQNVYSSRHMILSGVVLKKKQHLKSNAQSKSYRVRYSEDSPKCAVLAVAPVI